ncbi:hypothetical protein PRIPAC_94275 [Pristionchus pacificus]|uniref:Uncharacterized protein n=1 Tax=Pristionchus pacificus TaxID=54126 RepID=A0A2A6BA84_PRIPA|nr:hypothetical protein PRIPAC_94275 [Pristionchus pacificus]|eukprot:PDM62792.1 hypothetical protein PRIPAC_50007 [Pristionchus pacificus]
MNSSSINLFELPSTSSGTRSSSAGDLPPPLPPRLKRTRSDRATLRNRPIPRDYRRAHSDFVYIEDLISTGLSRLDKMEGGGRSVMSSSSSPPPPSPSPSVSPSSALPLPQSTRSFTFIARFRRSTRKLFCCLKPSESAASS